MSKAMFIINRCWIFFSSLVIIAYFKFANRLKVFGVEFVPEEGGVLLASNHVSMFETIIIPAVILSRMPGKKVFAPAKVELFRNPILRLIISSWGSFPVKRGSAHISGMKKIIELLKKEKVMVFPEGTRSKTGEIKRGNRMLGRLILEAKPVVVPVRIFGAEKILGKGDERPKPFHKITVKFGKPVNMKSFYTAKDNTKVMSQKIIDEVMEAISQLNM
jgi:1-acyl-sn-glycerol-3-phosphate acyltransferase